MGGEYKARRVSLLASFILSSSLGIALNPEQVTDFNAWDIQYAWFKGGNTFGVTVVGSVLSSSGIVNLAVPLHLLARVVYVDIFAVTLNVILALVDRPLISYS